MLPDMIGITADTQKNLKWKSLKWVACEDKEGKIRNGFLKHPFKYTKRLVASLVTAKPFMRQEEDFFFYGVEDEEEFRELLGKKNTFLIVGFSYCHKPFECPSGRFTDQCIRDKNSDVCRQCFIGKSMHFLPPASEAVVIPTIHHIGAKVFDLIEKHPGKEILFIITACEMTLTMFGDLGNMAGIRGIGVRLAGRICNTMKAFELSERGIKPGLTVVRDETKKRVLSLLNERHRRLQSDST